MARSESRFGFGQLSGSLGVGLLGLSVSQPWLRLDIAVAFREALQTKNLDQATAGQILFAGTSGPLDRIQDSPQVARLAGQLGVMPTGWEQNQWVGIAVVAAAAIALIGVMRSVFADSAWAARANAPLLGMAGLAALISAAVELWVLAPRPRAAMRPELGLWLLAAGGVCLLLGALTLGNNRRRAWIDDLDAQAPPKVFENTEHLAFSHGAWVPRVSNNNERR